MSSLERKVVRAVLMYLGRLSSPLIQASKALLVFSLTYLELLSTLLRMASGRPSVPIALPDGSLLMASFMSSGDTLILSSVAGTQGS